MRWKISQIHQSRAVIIEKKLNESVPGFFGNRIGWIIDVSDETDKAIAFVVRGVQDERLDSVRLTNVKIMSVIGLPFHLFLPWRKESTAFRIAWQSPMLAHKVRQSLWFVCQGFARSWFGLNPTLGAESPALIFPSRRSHLHRHYIYQVLSSVRHSNLNSPWYSLDSSIFDRVN